MMKKNKILIAIVLVMAMVFLNGCDSDIQIFKKNVDPYALVPVKDKALVNDYYYVKENTNFYATYKPYAGNSKQITTSFKENRVFMTMQDDSLIPPHYSDEFVAYTSDKIDLSTVVLERFKDLGYTIGCFSGTITADGYLYVSKRQGVVEGSSLYNAIGSTSSNDIRIAAINGYPLDKSLIDTSVGVITGFEKDKVYTVGYYIGTKYYEKDIVADCKAYAAYEMFYYDKAIIEDTPNGYYMIDLPDDLKSGIYNINGSGLFKYYDFPRGSQNEAEVDMNVSFYEDELSRIEAYSKQYNVSVPNRVGDFRIDIKYHAGDSELDSVRGVVVAPDGTRMEMDNDVQNQVLSLSMAEAMAGDWTVNVMPLTLSIDSVDVNNDKALEEATCEETTIYLAENRENIEIIAEYTIERTDKEKSTVFGTILAEDGKTYEMEISKDESDRRNPRYFISYEMPFAGAGEYTVRIYHYPEETTILKPEVRDKTQTQTQIIVVDG